MHSPSLLDRCADAARLVQCRGRPIPPAHWPAHWNDMHELEQKYWRDVAKAVLKVGAETLTASESWRRAVICQFELKQLEEMHQQLSAEIEMRSSTQHFPASLYPVAAPGRR
jgi:hypothetical protein